MTYGCEIKKILGIQLGDMRRQKKITLHEVAQSIHIAPEMLDILEIGTNVAWKYYKRLIRYYHCELKITCHD